jgi:rSAM/selenodomain-associated transferase 2
VVELRKRVVICGMISVVIPTLNAQERLAFSFNSLIPAAIEGIVSEVIVADGGSSDSSERIADAAGATFLKCAAGRGGQLRAGAQAARGRWLLFLHADTALEPGWEIEATNFIRDVEHGERADSAAAFRFALDDRGFKPRYLELAVAMRCAVLRMPYGDQGLLISRNLYDSIGGFRPIPLMEDVDLLRRLGRGRIAMLDARAVTSARRYKTDGYFARMLRNGLCLALFYFKAPFRYIVRLYG